jgi:23S rRNA (cytosine1962-C5)-methyltransferase
VGRLCADPAGSAGHQGYTEVKFLRERADARYLRSSEGGGHWEFRRKLPEEWEIGYKNLRFRISPTGFKHTGLFPEQAVNWDYAQQMIKSAGRNIRVLNLFAYTGAATLAAAEAGASVLMWTQQRVVRWARENARCSKLEEKPVALDCRRLRE